MNAGWRANELFLYERHGDRIVRRVERAQHCCFVRRAELTADLEREIRGRRYVRGVHQEGEWVRIAWATREIALKAACEFLPARKVVAYEGDVDPVGRWLQESDAEIARPRRCYLDLESDSRIPFSRRDEMRILCWAIVDDEGHEWTGVLDRDEDDDEHRILTDLWAVLDRSDQVLAWNGDRFDFPLLWARSAARRIARVDPRRWLWLDHMVLFDRMNQNAAESGEEKQSLALDAVCRTVLGDGEGKLEGITGADTWRLWAEGGESREKLVKYCLRDTTRLPALERKTGFIELLQTLADTCRQFPSTHAIGAKAQVEGYLLRLGWSRGTRAPTIDQRKFGEGPREKFGGAFVLPTKAGIHRGVHVCDFSRLYPSIIISWNLSPESWCPQIRVRETAEDRPAYLSHLPDRDLPIPDGHCVVPRVDRVFRNEPQGFLAIAVAEMLRLRAEWDTRKSAEPPGTVAWKEADRRSSAYKIAANSFFGVVGSPFSRFFVREVASSITAAGVWLLSATIREAETAGYRVIGGDTDSLFIQGCGRAEFASFVDRCNRDLYPRLLREQRCARASIKLAYEKEFSIIVMTTKKRYAGRYAHFKGKDATAASKPEIKGLEFKRGDSSRLARTLQKEVVDVLLALGPGEEHDDSTVERFDTIAHEWRSRILNAPIAVEDVAISKRLAKPLAAYARKIKNDRTAAAQPPHVMLAHELKRRGQDVHEGTAITYVVVDASTSPMKVAPVEDNPEPDRHYIWEDLVWPPTERVLVAAFPAHDWATIGKSRPPKIRKAPAETRVSVGRKRKLIPGQGGLPGMDLA